MSDLPQEALSTARVPRLYRAGFYSLLLAALLWIAFDISIVHEQAQAPGEKSFGVAVLAMLFLPTILFFAAAGVGTVLVTGCVLLYQKLSG